MTRLALLALGTLIASDALAANDVLIIYDIKSTELGYLVSDLKAAGLNPVYSTNRVDSYSSTTDDPNDYVAVVFFNQNYWNLNVPTASQTALVDYVKAGGGFVNSEMASYAYWYPSSPYASLLDNMGDLVLYSSYGYSYRTSVTVTYKSGYLTDLGAGFSGGKFTLGTSYSYWNNSSARTFSTDPVKSAASNGSNDAILVRELGAGRVVHFGILPATNYVLGDKNLRKAYVNAIQWAAYNNCEDGDLDGELPAWCGGPDCDDTDADVNTYADELCDEIDNNCDGSVDEDTAVDAPTWYADKDGDGFGNPASTYAACSTPGGYVDNALDCDDRSAAVSPAALERCNKLDDDCDGTVDDSPIDGSEYYADSDADGFGDASAVVRECSVPSGYVVDDRDCDDKDSAVFPGAAETAYDGIDQDCDGLDLVDADGDGYDADDPTIGGDDCDDTDPLTHPGAAELADGVDNDCDGDIDESTGHEDADGDGITPYAGDCDDTDASVHPGVIETCDGVDSDCNGIVDDRTPCYDDDGDGFSENRHDCDDTNPAVNPAATEIPDNGLDDDCDGSVDAGTNDADSDGFSPDGGDCDDANPFVNPGETEVANGIDDDCDGLADEGTLAYDDDGDCYCEQAPCTGTSGTCETAIVGGDCDDTNASVNPGMSDVENGADDDCNGVIDDDSPGTDDDGDGWSDLAGDCDDGDPKVNPAADELANGIDDDCDGLVDERLGDLDGDGVTVSAGDCDDRDPWRNAELPELCTDGIDNDCNLLADSRDPACVEARTPPATTTCSTAPPGAAWLGLVPLLALIRRRRR